MDEKSFDQREREQKAREQQRLGEEFAHPERAEGRRLGENFADANEPDDAKMGKLFAEANTTHEDEKKKGSKKVLVWFILIVVAVFGVVFLLAMIPRHNRDKENAKKADEEKNRKPVVMVETVKRDDHSGGLVLPGTTTPLTEAYVFARANGYLKTRLVDIGDHVQKGQLLAVIDSPDLDAQVAQAREQVRQAESQVAQQKTQLALTKITWDRWRVLVQKGVFARQDGDQKEADYLAAEANVAAAERNAQAFRANLQRVISLQAYEQVRAPFDGVITARNVDVGALISASGSTSGGATGPSGLGATNTGGTSGSSPTAGTATGGGDGSGAGALFSVAQVQRLRVLVAVPEGYASSVKPGQKTVMHFQEFPKQEFPADVTRTAGSIDQNTRTLLTEVQVDNRDGRLLAGMYAVVTFDGVTGAGPLMIPGDAIVIRENTTEVAVVEDGKIRMQPVEIGRDFGEAVEIVHGLKEGDVIATSVTDEVHDGAQVQAREESADKKKAVQHAPSNTLPGGSSQYGDQSITDQNLQGQANQTQQKKPASQTKKSESKP
jgi:multidrug efflux pump subunit AcrA (membrane-fusion protein)